jgi:hypothetical protein
MGHREYARSELHANSEFQTGPFRPPVTQKKQLLHSEKDIRSMNRQPSLTFDTFKIKVPNQPHLKPIRFGSGRNNKTALYLDPERSRPVLEEAEYDLQLEVRTFN